jgi:glycosyltransferase involved in cell wall biosynthesis
MSKKIVFVNQATGYITIDIINEFVKEYDEVAVIYGGNIREQDIPLHPKVTITSVVSKSRRSNFERGLKWFIATIQIYFLLITKYRNHEIFYFSVPPFSYFCSLFLNRKFSVMIFDVYPDVLRNFNVSERNPVYRLWEKLNQHLFPKSHKIYTIGNGLADILENYVEREKINVVPLWTGLTNITPLEKADNIFAKKHGLENKFVIQYSGNIGQTHNIECLIEAAEALKEFRDLSFLIIGRGAKVKKIKNLIAEKGLKNCSVLPFQPDDMIRYSLAVADIGVVVIDEKAAQMSVPSKVYNIMAVGSALLCIAPKNSELFNMVDRYQNGEVWPGNNVEGIKNYILKLYNDEKLLAQYKSNSVSASKNYTMRNASVIFHEYVGGALVQ